MTRDEQRLAWRTYAAAVSGDHEIQPRQCAKWADLMVVEERKRFDTPDHSGDATTKVERPWVDLTDEDIAKLAESWVEAWHEPRGLFAASSLIRMAQHRLQAKNGGTR